MDDSRLLRARSLYDRAVHVRKNPHQGEAAAGSGKPKTKYVVPRWSKFSWCLRCDKVCGATMVQILVVPPMWSGGALYYPLRLVRPAYSFLGGSD